MHRGNVCLFAVFCACMWILCDVNVKITHPNPHLEGFKGASAEEESERHELRPLHRPGDEGVLRQPVRAQRRLDSGGGDPAINQCTRHRQSHRGRPRNHAKGQ